MSTIPYFVHRNSEQFGDLPALSFAGETLNWRETQLKIAQVAQGLSELGVAKGDCVALMMSNRPEHWLTDQAAVHLGATPTTLYGTMPTSQIDFAAKHSRAVVAVLEGKDQVDRWLPILDDLPALRHVIVVDETALVAGDERFKTWDSLLVDDVDMIVFESRWRAVTPEDPATLIYTSGTTAVPKGVILTHNNVVSNVHSFDETTSLPEHFSNICFLPLAHIAERVISLYMLIIKAGHVTFCPNLDDLMPTLVAVRPTLFFAVPRVWEKIAAGLQMNAAATLADVGLDRVIWAFSAGAPLTGAVQQLFKDRDISIVEGWGMTETTGVATTTSAGELRIGTVGKVLAGNEMRMLDDGELLIRGPIVCAGYLQEDGSVIPAADEDGWMHTGDVGRLDEDGFLYIIDRKKELIITSGGKNVAPVAIEALLKKHPLVGQALAYGDRERYIVALVVLNAEYAPKWAEKNGVTYESLTDLSKHPRVIEEIQSAVDTANEDLARVEQVKRFYVLSSEWTVEAGELTPSLKMKRREVYTKYEDEIQSLYSDN